MAKMVLLITTKIERGIAVAEAWEAAGAPGVTLIESHGLRRLQEQSRAIEINLFVSMASLLRQVEETNQIILTVVDDDLVDTMIDAACDVLGGDLEQEGTGVAFVLPVERTVGLRRAEKKDDAAT
jgi:nitrogen regulatory protein PII